MISMFPIVAEIKDRTVTLTLEFDVAHAVRKPVDPPFQDEAPWKNDYE